MFHYFPAPASQPAWIAQLRHIYLAGSVAHLELHVPLLDHTLEADIAGEDIAELGLRPGARLRVAPRSAVVFAMDKSGEDAAVLGRWVWPFGPDSGRGNL